MLPLIKDFLMDILQGQQNLKDLKRIIGYTVFAFMETVWCPIDGKNFDKNAKVLEHTIIYKLDIGE